MNRFFKLLDVRGLKAGLLVLGLGINLGLTVLFFKVVVPIVTQQGGVVENTDVLLILGEFLVGFITGFGITLKARDKRGPNYGFLCAISGFVLVVFFMYQSGLLALLVAVSALLGGYNGGMLGERVLMNHQQ